MEKNSIGSYIKNKRKEKGLTQQELGHLLYVTDKAISKWERNVGLPDITLLTELAKVLDTSISNILNGCDTTNDDIDTQKELEKAKEIIKENNQKHKKIIISLTSLFIVIVISLIINNISFGYKLKKVKFSHFYQPKEITLGIPKTSFMMKYHDKSFSFKNFRNKNILENEIKKYLKTLKYLSCNDTIYYYNETDNFSITSYSVDNHLFYNTINYTIIDDDYCNREKIKEYQEKLGGLRKIHHLNLDYTSETKWEDKLVIVFTDSLDYIYDPYNFKATLSVEYLTLNNNNKVDVKIIEYSSGNYEIKDNKLYYYRTKIDKKSNDTNIPEVSTFKLDNGKMILLDDYLNKYYKEDIILK